MKNRYFRFLIATLLLASAAMSAIANPPAAYEDGRPAARLRLDARDQGVVLRHGAGPNQCDYLGARDVWAWQMDSTTYLHYDGAGPQGWQAYGDTRIVERCWPCMVKFMDWRKSTSANFLGIVHGNDWGDWLSIGGKTPLDFVDTVYFAYSANLMSQMAAAIGKPAAAAEYGDLFNHIKLAFDQKYVKPDGSLTVDTETAYALGLYMNLIPEDLRLKSGNILADKLRADETTESSGMTTGFLGTRPLLPVITSVGQNDLVVKQF